MIPPLDFWLRCVAVRMIDRFLDGQRAYYTPCRISSRSCESVRLWRCEALTYGAVVFITQPAFSIMRLQLNSDGGTSKTSSVQKKGGVAHESIMLNAFTREALVLLTDP